MHVNNKDKIDCIENWLIVLTNTYAKKPSKQLAQVIHYYIKRLLSTEGFQYHPQYCQYLSMQKYWRWVGIIQP